MQVSVESIGKLERRMQVQVPAERVSKEIAVAAEGAEPHGALERLSARQGAAHGDPPAIRPASASRSDRRAAAVELLRSGHPESARAGRQPAHRAAERRRGSGPDLRGDVRGVFRRSLCGRIDSLEIERVTAEVTEGDIDAMIERLRKQQMKYTAVTRAAASGDKVTVEFRGLDRRHALCRRQGRERGDRRSARAACWRSSSRG